jgi:hypothetical protein
VFLRYDGRPNTLRRLDYSLSCAVLRAKSEQNSSHTLRLICTTGATTGKLSLASNGTYDPRARMELERRTHPNSVCDAVPWHEHGAHILSALDPSWLIRLASP